MVDEIVPVVIQNGSNTIKAGFAGDDTPNVVFPSIIGKPRNSIEKTEKECYFGEEAKSKRGILMIKYMIENGMIVNFDDMEKIWHHTFYNELRINPEEHPLLLTESPLNPRANREKITQIMFETFKTPAFYLENTSVLSLYASGRKTGVVIDWNDNMYGVHPVYEGSVLNHSILHYFVSANDITFYLIKMLNEKGYSFQTSAEFEIVKDIQEKCCYVSLDFDKELDLDEKMIQKNYELPNGQVISIGNERFRAPEVIFKPSLIGMEQASVSETLYNTILKCDHDIRKELYANIVLSGENSFFPGISQRFAKEISEFVPSVINVNVISPENQNSVWIGGSIFASLSGFVNLCISKDDYEDFGPSLIHRKCF
ncbi:actin-42a [Anaeramoeba ignava]|uniref:Actin-42a n=1 Tax=Anaeramoeba ignava TaxID=1746090 RepID=A0A9Q0LYW2_ANAIG|nr:actin-42a [Anaeramoeba ignava]